jgi:hypothetical protein
MRNKLGDWNTSVAVARILSHDGLIASLGNFYGDGSWYWYDSFRWSGYDGLVANAGGGSLYLFDNAKESRTTQLLVSLEKPYTAQSGWSASVAYTYSHAKERLVSNGDYQFDYAHPQLSPFVLSNQLPTHRLVAAGSIDVPWGFIVGAKFVLETPKPLAAFDGVGTEPANGVNYNYLKISQFPKDRFGYRTLDLQVTKNFSLPGSTALQLRLDALNVLNTRNYAFLFDGYPGRPYYYTDGDITGVTRTIKLTVSVKR